MKHCVGILRTDEVHVGTHQGRPEDLVVSVVVGGMLFMLLRGVKLVD